jgi:NTP pyrophosphatase (non-canonical NTP hydrolase)
MFGLFKNTYEIQDFYEDQCKFNDLSGASQKVDKEDLNNQVKLIQEELKETIDAIDVDNQVETIDGAVDLLFVTMGLLQKLSNSGYDTETAMKKVAENNLSKFPTDFKIVTESIKHYADKGIKVTWSFNNEYKCYVLFDENNKVRKPVDYISVDLSDCVPT